MWAKAKPKKHHPAALPAGRSHTPDGLFDLALVPADDGGLARPGDPGASLGVEQIVDLVRRAGQDRCDLRVLVADGAHHRALFAVVAKRLERDVLVTPVGAELCHPSEIGTGADPAEGFVPVDRASGRPVDWLVIQPADLVTTLPGWFELTGGQVLARQGMVTLPLPAGVALASRTDFVTRRAAAAGIGAGHPGLVTVAVTVSTGGFVVGDHAGRLAVLGGTELAAALPAMPLYGADLRLWLDWPGSQDDQRRLHGSLDGLAQATGATVWTPPIGGRAKLLDSCRDLAAVDGDGGIGNWVAHQPPPATPERFETDEDGRLAPVGGWWTDSHPGVPLVSVPVKRQAEMAAQYARISPRDGLFLADLAVLDDGRLAARAADDTLIALGPRGLRALLRKAGWSDADVALLCPVPAERAAGLHRHLGYLGAELGVDIYLLAAGSELTVDDDGLVRAIDPAGPSGSWCRLSAVTATDRPVRWRDHEGKLLPVTVVERHATRRALEPVARPAQPETDFAAEVDSPAVPGFKAESATVPESSGQGQGQGHGQGADHATDDQGEVVTPDSDDVAGLLRWRTIDPDVEQLRLAVRIVLASLEAGDPAQSERLARLATVFADRQVEEHGKRRPAAQADAVLVDLVDQLDQGLATVRSDVGAELVPAAAAVASLDGTPVSRPRLIVAARSSRPHGVSWLSGQLQVNVDPFELFLGSTWDPQRSAVEGVPSPELFLRGRLHPRLLADELDQGDYLLRVRVEPGGAVDLSASEARPPSEVQHLFRQADVYLLPAGWLDRSRILAGYRVMAGGQLVPGGTFAPTLLTIHCVDARHGAEGLPNELRRWPQRRLREVATGYVLLPLSPQEPLDSWVTVHRRQPPVSAGHRLAELRIGRGRAIDVAASATELAPYTAVRSRLVEMRSSGIEVVLPRRSYDRVTVNRLFEADGESWRLRAGSLDLPLTSLVGASTAV